MRGKQLEEKWIKEKKPTDDNQIWEGYGRTLHGHISGPYCMQKKQKKKIAPNCLLSYYWQTLFSVDGPNQPMDLTQDCFQPSVIFFQDCNSPSHLVLIKPQSPISISLLCKVISFLFDLHCISESSSKAPRSGSSSTFPTTSSLPSAPPTTLPLPRRVKCQHHVSTPRFASILDCAPYSF